MLPSKRKNVTHPFDTAISWKVPPGWWSSACQVTLVASVPGTEFYALGIPISLVLSELV